MNGLYVPLIYEMEKSTTSPFTSCVNEFMSVGI